MSIIMSSSEALCDVSEHPCFYSVRLLASSQTPKLEDHSWSAIHDWLFNIIAANLHLGAYFSIRNPGDAPCPGDKTPWMSAGTLLI